MKLYISILITALITISCSEAPKDPIAILNASMMKAMEINSASYRMQSLTITGADTQAVNRRIYIKRNDTDTLVGLKLKIVDEDSSAVYYDGNNFILIDDYSRKVIVPDSAMPAAFIAVGLLDIQSMIIKRGDGKLADKNQNNIQYSGAMELNGRKLEIVKFSKTDSTTKQQSEVKYYFSSDDKLLRKIEMTGVKGNSKYYQLIQVNELNINAPMPDSIFAPSIPTDYTKQLWK